MTRRRSRDGQQRLAGRRASAPGGTGKAAVSGADRASGRRRGAPAPRRPGRARLGRQRAGCSSTRTRRTRPRRRHRPSTTCSPGTAWTADLSIDRWHPVEEEWSQPTCRCRSADAAIRGRASRGWTQWRRASRWPPACAPVRDAGAAAVASRLGGAGGRSSTAEGYAVVRRWRFLVAAPTTPTRLRSSPPASGRTCRRAVSVEEVGSHPVYRLRARGGLGAVALSTAPGDCTGRLHWRTALGDWTGRLRCCD